jgi:hypothetical protein
VIFLKAVGKMYKIRSFIRTLNLFQALFIQGDLETTRSSSVSKLISSCAQKRCNEFFSSILSKVENTRRSGVKRGTVPTYLADDKL